MRYLILAVIAIALIYVIYRLTMKARDKAEARKVIRMSLHRGNKKYANKQKCSICHLKSKRLTFYANEYGKAIGVCDKCRPIAERRALLKL